jgi:hypothetical protein
LKSCGGKEAPEREGEAPGAFQQQPSGIGRQIHQVLFKGEREKYLVTRINYFKTNCYSIHFPAFNENLISVKKHNLFIAFK